MHNIGLGLELAKIFECILNTIWDKESTGKHNCLKASIRKRKTGFFYNILTKSVIKIPIKVVIDFYLS